MDDLQEMLEHYRITRLVGEYCHGCDRMDGARMAGVYAEDSWDDHGAIKLPGREFAATVMTARAESKDMMSHLLGQTLVKLDGDQAGAETYFVATVGRRDDAGNPVIHQLGGRYVDDLVRIDGNWKVKKRLTVRDWSITHPVVHDHMATLEFIEGQTSGSDPSFAALGIRHSGNADILATVAGA